MFLGLFNCHNLWYYTVDILLSQFIIQWNWLYNLNANTLGMVFLINLWKICHALLSNPYLHCKFFLLVQRWLLHCKFFLLVQWWLLLNWLLICQSYLAKIGIRESKKNDSYQSFSMKPGGGLTRSKLPKFSKANFYSVMHQTKTPHSFHMSNLVSYRVINYYWISERVENYEFCSVGHQRKKKDGVLFCRL